jgi:(p)ppGpp synthase/HD superfamily hydrolase
MENLKKLSRQELFNKLCHYDYIKRSKVNDQLVRKAYDLVCRIHINEPDRPDGPYINHLLRVAIICLEFGANDINIVVAALLHRSAEDQAEKINTKMVSFLNSADPIRTGALMEIGDMFGHAVEQYVTRLTNPDLTCTPEGVDKQKVYIEHTDELVKQDPKAALIKLADFYDKALVLSEIKDIKLRKTLCVRYKPIFEIFIPALSNKKIAFLDAKKTKRISKELRVGHAFIKKELKN